MKRTVRLQSQTELYVNHTQSKLSTSQFRLIGAEGNAYCCVENFGISEIIMGSYASRVVLPPDLNLIVYYRLIMYAAFSIK